MYAGARSGEPGRPPARPARTKIKALHVPGLGASNSLSSRRLSATESNRVAHIDSIVLHMCYATACYRRLRRMSDSHDNFRNGLKKKHEAYP